MNDNQFENEDLKNKDDSDVHEKQENKENENDEKKQENSQELVSLLRQVAARCAGWQSLTGSSICPIPL